MQLVTGPGGEESACGLVAKARDSQIRSENSNLSHEMVLHEGSLM
jgi:hypothetical protein